MRKLGSLLILCAATVCFSGCALRGLGPCYGFGCPAFSSSNSTPTKSATENAPAAKSRHNNNAQARNATAAQSQTNPGQ